MMDRRFYCEDIKDLPPVLHVQKLRDCTFEFCFDGGFDDNVFRKKPDHEVGSCHRGWRYLHVDAKRTIEGKWMWIYEVEAEYDVDSELRGDSESN